MALSVLLWLLLPPTHLVVTSRLDLLARVKLLFDFVSKIVEPIAFTPCSSLLQVGPDLTLVSTIRETPHLCQPLVRTLLLFKISSSPSRPSELVCSFSVKLVIPTCSSSASTISCFRLSIRVRKASEFTS